MNCFYTLLQAALTECNPNEKCQLVDELSEKYRSGSLKMDVNRAREDILMAGCPEKPELVPPYKVTQRKISTLEGYAAMLHSIVHIEFNAINLALDAAYRFRTLSEQFAADWLQVAKEECDHFRLMQARLQSLDYEYGDFLAHGHLWDMALKTAYDPLLRMALVPRVLEARGLDVTPAIREKVQQRGDAETVAVLDVIYRDEVGHVKKGNFWYQYLCRQRGLEPLALFRKLLQQYDMFIFRGYVNMEAREEAGFTAFELAMLENFEQSLQVAS